jgi:glycosyltransferase involved in cell wall biosynthesis
VVEVDWLSPTTSLLAQPSSGPPYLYVAIMAGRPNAPTMIYEGGISSTAVGGARVHFGGMARAIERVWPGRVVVVLPRFAGEAMYDPGVGDGVRVIGVRTLRRSLVGHVIYEAFKTVVLIRLRLSDVVRRRATTHMMRISPVGVSPLATRMLGARVVVEVNGLPDSEFRARRFGRAVVAAVRLTTSLQLRSATHVIAVTDGIAAAARERTGAPVLRIENGVDLGDVPVDGVSEGSPHTLVYSGAFAPWQELELLVEAIALLREADPERAWRLLLIGDGEDRRVVERAAQRLGVTDRVEITGWLDRSAAVERLLEGRIAIVPLLPKGDSEICGSPLKLFEYLAVGRSVVGSDVDGIVELQDYPVEVYRRRDVESLVAAIRDAAANAAPTDEELQALRQRISWDDRCRRLVDFVVRGVQPVSNRSAR